MSSAREQSQTVSELGSGYSEFPMVAQPDNPPRLTQGSNDLGSTGSNRMQTQLQQAGNATAVAATSHAAASAMAPPALDDVELFDLSSSPNKADPEPEVAEIAAKRARSARPTSTHRLSLLGKAPKVRLPSPRRASSEPDRARVGRSPSRRSVWPSPSAAQHRHIPLDPSVSDVANLNKLVEQLSADAEHMLVLKGGRAPA